MFVEWNLKNFLIKDCKTWQIQNRLSLKMSSIRDCFKQRNSPLEIEFRTSKNERDLVVSKLEKCYFSIPFKSKVSQYSLLIFIRKSSHKDKLEKIRRGTHFLLQVSSVFWKRKKWKKLLAHWNFIIGFKFKSGISISGFKKIFWLSIRIQNIKFLWQALYKLKKGFSMKFSAKNGLLVQ